MCISPLVQNKININTKKTTAMFSRVRAGTFIANSRPHEEPSLKEVLDSIG